MFKQFFKTDMVGRLTKIALLLTKIVMLVFVAILFNLFQDRPLKSLIMIVIGKCNDNLLI